MKELDYLEIIRALDEIPFNVGKKLLVDFLQGNENNASIIKNKLFRLNYFGALAYETNELMNLIDRLLLNKLIVQIPLQTNTFIKVLGVTEAGFEELKNPTLNEKKLSNNYEETKTIITEEDKEKFKAFGDFLTDFNDEQCKAIISNSKYISCIAGAGSGKTTVLTKRIEFLTKFKSVDESKILAITFTRKARQEMMHRLEELNINNVQVETFNSFCEKKLKAHNDLIYDRPVHVMSFRDRFTIINEALKKYHMTMSQAINTYFEYSQRKSKTDEQLAMIFMNDCFFVRDYLKFKNKCFDESLLENDDTYKQRALQLIFNMYKYIDSYMEEKGLRDFADQLLDTIKLFKKNPHLIPEFEHVLVDEYQDVNSTQIEFINLLKPENLFIVGDPRQSIYGWRGSDIKYILEFKDNYEDAEIISLTKNYRSNSHIVTLFNESIRNMTLPDLESNYEGEKDIKLLNFKSQDAEFEYVIQTILHSEEKEIFVLARTNRQLNELSELMKSREIKHIIRSDEQRKPNLDTARITLATIHGIKGLEANTVFVIGCNGQNFPCRASEHPVIDLIKVDEYDKEEEERRLFYVALSRAKNHLYISYSKSMTAFISDKMLKLMGSEKLKTQTGSTVASRLKEWRREKASQLKVPAFYIMSDLTLNEIVNKNPTTKMELNYIHGFGPIKIMKYGEEILDLIQ